MNSNLMKVIFFFVVTLGIEAAAFLFFTKNYSVKPDPPAGGERLNYFINHFLIHI
jgi:hypothetical protein